MPTSVTARTPSPVSDVAAPKGDSMRWRRLTLALVLLGVPLLAGCSGRQPPKPDYDPWEPFNRKMFWVNDKLDVYALEPVARGWDYVTPDVVQRGISRFFNNLR